MNPDTYTYTDLIQEDTNLLIEDAREYSKNRQKVADPLKKKKRKEKKKARKKRRFDEKR